MSTKDVVVIGPGAIGCTFGAALIQAGHHVVFAGRTPFDRLVVQHDHGEVAVDATCLTSPADVRPAAMVLLATKAHQVPGAAEFIRASCGPGTVVAVLQNGIDHEARVRPFLHEGGSESAMDVLGVMVACPADRHAPGQVNVTGRALLEVQASPAGLLFAEAFTGSFASVRPVDDMCTSLWRKLMLNTVGGGIGVLTRRSNEVFVSDDQALSLARSLANEVLAVAQADGAKLDEKSIDWVIAMLEMGSTHFPSIVVDRMNGHPTEWEIRNQIIVDKGVEHGVATPLNAMLSTLIRLGEPASN